MGFEQCVARCFELLKTIPDEQAISAAAAEGEFRNRLVPDHEPAGACKFAGRSPDIDANRTPVPLFRGLQESSEVTTQFHHAGAWLQQFAIDVRLRSKRG